jgi:hypothetical protein
MLLIGVNRSPFTRRVAITLTIYGMKFEQRALSGFGNRAEVRAANPLGRVPALVLDNGEALVDSFAIIDHLARGGGEASSATLILTRMGWRPSHGRCVNSPYAVVASRTPSSAAIRSRMMNFCIFPVTVIGKSSTKRICRGTL